MSMELKFEPDMKQVSKLLGREVADVRRLITLKLLEKITRKTPVLDGRLRSSWFTSDGVPSDEVAPEGARTDSQENITATFKDPYATTFIVNNLPYAARIEFDGWSHTKAPAGMVRVSLAEVQAELGSFL